MRYALDVFRLMGEDFGQTGVLVDAHKGFWTKYDQLRCLACEDRVHFREGIVQASCFAHYDIKKTQDCTLRVKESLGGPGGFGRWFRGQSLKDMGQWVWEQIEKTAYALGVDVIEPLNRYKLVTSKQEEHKAKKLHEHWKACADSRGRLQPVVICEWARKYSSTGTLIDYGVEKWLDCFPLIRKWASQYNYDRQFLGKLGRSVKGAADWGRQTSIAYSLYSYVGLLHNQQTLLPRTMSASFALALNVIFPEDKPKSAVPGERIPVYCSEELPLELIHQLTLAIAQLLILGVDWYREHLIAIQNEFGHSG